jgi:hypothetical protein
MAGHIATAKSTDWCTPAWLVDLVHDVLEHVDLDPCSNAQSVVGAHYNYFAPGEAPPSQGEDGLAHYWFGRVYVNPPYGRDLPAWVRHAVQEYACGHAEAILMLIPANVDTRVWQDLIFPRAARIAFLAGRVRFVGAAASAPMPVALVLFTPSQELCDRFDRVLRPHAAVLRHWTSRAHAAGRGAVQAGADGLRL